MERCRLIRMHGTLNKPEGRTVRDFIDVICAAIIVAVIALAVLGFLT